MNAIVTQDAIGAQLDAQAAARADELADADAGRELCRQMDDQFLEEGRQLYEAGHAIDRCWNHMQRRGFTEAAEEARAYIWVVGQNQEAS